jgi:hypothetical protein
MQHEEPPCRVSAGLVRLLSPHFRAASYLPPVEIAKQLLAGRPWDPSQPCLPLFFSLATAVKATPRLLLRNAPSTESSCGDGEGAAAGGSMPAACSGGSRGCALASTLSLLGLLFRGGRVGAKQGQPPAQQQALPTLLSPPTMPGSLPPPTSLQGSTGPPSEAPASANAAAHGLAATGAPSNLEEWTLKAVPGPASGSSRVACSSQSDAARSCSLGGISGGVNASAVHEGMAACSSASSIGGSPTAGASSSGGGASWGGGAEGSVACSKEGPESLGAIDSFWWENI